MQTWAGLLNQVTILGQLDDPSSWIAPAVMLVVVLLVAALAFASRRNVDGPSASPEDRPKASEGDAGLDHYTTDVAKIRERGFDEEEIEAILNKDPEQRTMAERKKLNLAKKASKGLKERVSAVEQTQRVREEHQRWERIAAEEQLAAEEELAAEGREAHAKEREGAEAEAAALEAMAAAEQAVAAAELEMKRDAEAEQSAKAPVASEPAKPEEAPAEPEEPEEKSFEEGLGKTRDGFSKEFFGLFKGKEQLDEGLRDAIEEFLYTSDIGAKAATKIMSQIDRTKDDVKRDPTKVWEFVRRYITEEMLAAREQKLDLGEQRPFVMLIVGVNGAGKTTTIGKLASRFKRQGKSVLVVAGDTFRAAAVEQLEVWTERVDVPIHKGKREADPASVVFDGIERGVEEGFDVILCDTSGRLHTDVKLMDELKKIERVSGKALEGAPHETVLVLDANSGQNAVAQARTFGKALGVSGLILTKLDGTARGGVIMGIGEELDVPVRFVGIGEGIKDLREFDAREFADALFL